jgi:uncharacterized membrane protein
MNDVFTARSLSCCRSRSRRAPAVLRARALALLLLGVACSTTPNSDKSVTPDPGAAGAAGAHDIAPATDADWCDARSVLEAKCWRCHADPPTHGAPFSLLTYDDTQVVSAKGTPRFETIADAVSTDLMPARFVKVEPPVLPLSDSEKQTLLDWCKAGAPAARDARCDEAP